MGNNLTISPPPMEVSATAHPYLEHSRHDSQYLIGTYMLYQIGTYILYQGVHVKVNIWADLQLPRLTALDGAASSESQRAAHRVSGLCTAMADIVRRSDGNYGVTTTLVYRAAV